jgi:ubiquitin-conjugating enzyme E2 D
MTKRLKIEALDLGENPLEWATAEPIEGCLFEWKALVIGPEDSPYQNGVFIVSITIPTSYPFRPPIVTFRTKVYHPNVNTYSGAICDHILKEEWRPTMSLRWVLAVIRTLLESPSLDHPLEPEIAREMNEHPETFHKTAKEWTKQFASWSPD